MNQLTLGESLILLVSVGLFVVIVAIVFVQMRRANVQSAWGVSIGLAWFGGPKRLHDELSEVGKIPIPHKSPATSTQY